ncbi:response regulator [Wenzhouxiangella sp. XN24]|uniref:response regulator n=1 Tax=Wenzhouxiangella sp. XN24 TaxID=2713569 RepID=UPI0013EDEC63|nr:response regulator [Wenzhouxiangella sp. XN24]NGX17579.1 PAS domain-containing protein [Wenzhouxiangella sp. XN24]
MSQSLRILLLADDPEVIRRVGQGLQREESGLIMIEGAESLATARRRLGADSYDLALVDLAMGLGDGLHLLSDLAGIAPDLPVVALGTAGSGPDAAACRALGAQDRIGPEAVESAGLVDRLHSAVARARADTVSRRRQQRVAASLGATGDLAWHYEQGGSEVWLAARNPADWQLPAPECAESLEAVRERVHPDDRELVLRQVAEHLATDQPWQLDARIKVGGGAYRWCTVRGRAQFDDKNRLLQAAGTLADAQRQQKRIRETEQGRRFLRAVFDSARVARAVLDSSAVIIDCNQAWTAFEEPACHAGRAFGPGRRFIEKSEDPEVFGDLDCTALRRGVRQVLGGVVDRFSIEYDAAGRRWRIAVNPLLNPGIAGAVVSHEDITQAQQATTELRAATAELEADFGALGGPMFRVAPDFEVLAANDHAEAFGRAPVRGRDVLKVLPRPDAEAVGDALAAIAAGGESAVRDVHAEDGRLMRWVVSPRRGAAGDGLGFVVYGVDCTDLAQREVAAEVAPTKVDDTENTRLAELLEAERQRYAELAETLDAERSGQEQLAATLEAERGSHEQLAQTLEDERGRHEELAQALQAERARYEELSKALQAERANYEELSKALEAERSRHEQLAETLEAERQKQDELAAALAAAEQVPARLRAELGDVRQGLRSHLDDIVQRVFEPLLNDSETGGRDARLDQDKDKAS